MKLRLMGMNFFQFAVWGAYLISMGTYLFNAGMGDKIGYFYAMQGIVSLFMPALMGVVADRWIQAQKLLAICHLLGAVFMMGVGYMAMDATLSPSEKYPMLLLFYILSSMFYMPTLALSNSVSYTALESVNLDIVKDFPPIRVLGTIGFISAMLLTDVLGFQTNYMQFFLSVGLGVLAAGYAITLPECPINDKGGSKSWQKVFGWDAFKLFKQWNMALFFVFSMLLGVALQITNGFANPYLNSFASIPMYADTFGVLHSNMLISLSQLSETLCLLLIPFALRHFGIKYVMLISMFCWVLRFGLFGLGNPGDGVWMFILSMLVYGMAFDFFNVSGSLFVDKETDLSVRSSAQGLFMMMTNGLGATIGTIFAQQVINLYVDFESPLPQVEGWSKAWFTFAGYMLVVALLFAIFFKDKHHLKRDI